MKCQFLIFVYMAIAMHVAKGAILNTSKNSTAVKNTPNNCYNPQKLENRLRLTVLLNDQWVWGTTEDLTVNERQNDQRDPVPYSSTAEDLTVTEQQNDQRDPVSYSSTAEDLTVTEQIFMATPQPTEITSQPDTESSTLSEFEQILADYYADETNPCIKKLPEMPDFSRPGRRISEQKCYEYIWDIKHREDQKEYDDICYKHLTVVGGQDALPGEFPHMAAVGWKAADGTWIFKCGSSLISSKFVLTAAHCSMASDRDTSVADLIPKIVRLGDKNIADVDANDTKPIDVNIVKIIVHPKYKSPKKYYDIALMELEIEVKFTSNIQPACLWSKFDTSPLGNKANVTGWGVTGTAKLTTSPVLQVAEIDILDSKICDELLVPITSRHWKRMYDHHLCAGILAGGVDACLGDSGGPLQVRINLPTSKQGAIHHLIGVTSFGVGCALPNTPGVYTRVSSFIDWIESIVWK